MHSKLCQKRKTENLPIYANFKIDGKGPITFIRWSNNFKAVGVRTKT